MRSVPLENGETILVTDERRRKARNGGGGRSRDCLSYKNPTVTRSNNDAPPLPVAVVRRKDGCLLHRQRRQRAGPELRVYCEDEPGRRSAAKLLIRDEARRIAANRSRVRSEFVAAPCLSL